MNECSLHTVVWRCLAVHFIRWWCVFWQQCVKFRRLLSADVSDLHVTVQSVCSGCTGTLSVCMYMCCQGQSVVVEQIKASLSKSSSAAESPSVEEWHHSALGMCFSRSNSYPIKLSSHQVSVTSLSNINWSADRTKYDVFIISQFYTVPAHLLTVVMKLCVFEPYCVSQCPTVAFHHKWLTLRAKSGSTNPCCHDDNNFGILLQNFGISHLSNHPAVFTVHCLWFVSYLNGC